MKKLGKLIINPEKVIKSEELVNLRGGYGVKPGNPDYWICDCDGSDKTFYASSCADAENAASNFCSTYKCCDE